MNTLEEINVKGFAEEFIDPSLDLFDEIEKLKKKKNAVILAHYYQEPDIQDIADYIGDSLRIIAASGKNRCGYYRFAGVLRMAETAKILSPSKSFITRLKGGMLIGRQLPGASV